MPIFNDDAVPGRVFSRDQQIHSDTQPCNSVHSGPPCWNITDAIELARILEPIAIECNMHVALGGSVLVKGWSSKDCDIFFYTNTAKGAPPSTHPINVIDMCLERFQCFEYIPNPSQKENAPSASDEADVVLPYKLIRRMTWKGKRVDFIFILKPT